MSAFDEFFLDLDALWAPPSERPLVLAIIGSAALMLQADYERGTKDSDVLETPALDSATQGRLRRLAGKDSALKEKHRMYVDIIANGIPFLPHKPLCHPQEALNRQLRNFEIHVLDVVDVVVSKLKRFHADDRADIAAMIERDLVPHDTLRARFESAVDVFAYDARADELPKYVRNFHTVERDFLGIAETEFDLPDWISR